MGSVSRIFYGSGYFPQWTYIYTFSDEFKISASTFKISDIAPTVTAKRVWNTSGTWSNDIIGTADASFTILGKSQYYKVSGNPYVAWADGATKALTNQSGDYTLNTSAYFNSNNPTIRRIQIQATNSGSAYVIDNYYGLSYSGALSSGTSNIGYIVLDVPPTATVSVISYDTGYVYANLTTASVTVSDSTAYYGGTIDTVEFTIGNQTDTLSGDGTLSIALNAGGVFTPTVTVTDSRGQTKTYSLDPITVNTYTAPTVSFDVERTDANGDPDDEGTYCLIEATLTFADVIATAVAPSVVITDENGTQTTPTVTWYTDDTLTTTVTWASVSSGDTVYGLFSGVNTQYSYSVSVRPRDSEGTGTAITQTLGSAFYTVDFLAGGHGIAFGKPASNVGFECAMSATFENIVDIDNDLNCNDDVYISLPDYQTADTTDKAIYDAIVSLGWDADVLVN